MENSLLGATCQSPHFPRRTLQDSLKSDRCQGREDQHSHNETLSKRSQSSLKVLSEVFSEDRRVVISIKNTQREQMGNRFRVRVRCKSHKENEKYKM